MDINSAISYFSNRNCLPFLNLAPQVEGETSRNKGFVENIMACLKGVQYETEVGRDARERSKLKTFDEGMFRLFDGESEGNYNESTFVLSEDKDNYLRFSTLPILRKIIRKGTFLSSEEKEKLIKHKIGLDIIRRFLKLFFEEKLFNLTFNLIASNQLLDVEKSIKSNYDIKEIAGSCSKQNMAIISLLLYRKKVSGKVLSPFGEELINKYPIHSEEELIEYLLKLLLGKDLERFDD